MSFFTTLILTCLTELTYDQALRHSKVKLTWDDDDPERHQVTRRALTKKEIEENDFRTYIANSSSEDEEDDKPKKTKKDKKASRDKLRSLLLGGNDDAIPEGWGDEGGGGDGGDVDMEITFTPGLSGKKNEEDETTLEKYQRKMKEKRKKRKEEVKEDVVGEKVAGDDFFEASEDEAAPVEKDDQKGKGKSKKGKKDISKIEKDTAPRTEATAEELALLVASENPDAEPKHFNIKSVIKAEKQKKRRKGKKGKADEDNEIQEDFVMNVKDDRFKVLFEDHQFAIDPTNPQYDFLDFYADIWVSDKVFLRFQIQEDKGDDCVTR